MIRKAIIPAAVMLALAITGCQESKVQYSGAEYIMFSDTLSVNPVLQDAESFTVPVVSTVACDYDRTFAVEVLDEGSTAIEGRDYRLRSNTLTIKAGEYSANVEVLPVYGSFNDTDTLSFSLQLVVPDQLRWGLYGDRTKVSMFKVCPFSLDNFTGWCVVTSLFLYSYPGQNTSYQRLIRTEKVEGRENTILMKDWLYDGYDVTMTFSTDDPSNPLVSMDKDQILSDEESVFGQVNGDNRILVTNSPYYVSYFNSCQKFVSLWIQAYVNNMSSSVGTVGHFYHVIEWVSDEEAERLQKEEGM